MSRSLTYSAIPFKFKNNGKPCSRTDFNEQKQRNSFILHGDEFWCWDDAPSNKSKPGDIFAFWEHDGGECFGPGHSWQSGRFIFHVITDVKPSSERLPSWSKNVGQGTRNVLELSKPIFEKSYTEMIQCGVKLTNRGTTYCRAGFNEGDPLRDEIESKL